MSTEALLKRAKLDIEFCINAAARAERRRVIAEEGLRKTTNRYNALLLQHERLLEDYTQIKEAGENRVATGQRRIVVNPQRSYW